MNQAYETEVEVTHEALIRHWDRLQSWLDESRDIARVVNRVRSDARNYFDSEANPDNLTLRGAILEEAAHLLDATPPRLASEEAIFVRLCQQKQNDDEQEKIRQAEERASLAERGRRIAVIAAVVSLVLLSIAAVAWKIALHQKSLAEDANKKSEARLLRLETKAAIVARDKLNYVKAAHHFARAADLAKEADQASSLAMAADVLLERISLDAQYNHESPLVGGKFLDVNRILSWSNNGTIACWNTADGSERFTLQHGGFLDGMHFNSNNKKALSYGAGVVKLWNLIDGVQIRQDLNHELLLGAAFDSEEKLIVSWGFDGNVRIWDANTCSLINGGVKPIGEGKGLANISLSTKTPTKILAWGDQDQVIRKLDLQTDRFTKSAILPTIVKGANFFDEDKRMIVWGTNGFLVILDSQTLDVVEDEFSGSHTANVTGASEQDGWIVSWGEDSTAKAFRLIPDQSPLSEVLEMDHAQSEVFGATYYREKSLFISFGNDRTARIWNQFDKSLLATIRHEGPILGARFVDDQESGEQYGLLTLSWSADGSAKLWKFFKVGDDSWVKMIGEMPHEKQIVGVDVADNQILTLSDDGVAKLWSLQTGVSQNRSHKQIAGGRFENIHSSLITWGNRIRKMTSVDPARVKTWSNEPLGETNESWSFDSDIRDAARFGKGVVVRDDNGIWYLENDGEQTEFTKLCKESNFQQFAHGSDSKCLIGWGKSGLIIVDQGVTEPSLQFVAELGSVFCAGFTLRGDLVACNKDGANKIDLLPGGAVTTATGDLAGNFQGAFFDDQYSKAIFWRDGQVYGWNYEDNEYLRLANIDVNISGGVVSSGDMYAVWGEHEQSGDASIFVSSIGSPDGEPLEFRRSQQIMLGGHFLDDSNLLLTWDIAGKKCVVYDLVAGSERCEVNHLDAIVDVSVSKSNGLVLSFTLRDVWLWDSQTGDILLRLENAHLIRGVSFCGDDSFCYWDELGKIVFRRYTTTHGSGSENDVQTRTGTILSPAGVVRNESSNK